MHLEMKYDKNVKYEHEYVKAINIIKRASKDMYTEK